jgi:hypothetical protein
VRLSGTEPASITSLLAASPASFIRLLQTPADCVVDRQMQTQDPPRILSSVVKVGCLRACVDEIDRMARNHARLFRQRDLSAIRQSCCRRLGKQRRSDRANRANGVRSQQEQRRWPLAH